MEQRQGIVVGITGQSGGGKTLVASLLSKYGFHIIDADVVSRKVVEKGRPALQHIVDRYGSQVLQIDGNLDRSKMAAIAFSSTANRNEYNGIIFPYILDEIETQIQMLKNHGANAIFIDAPTLFESGADRLCDKVVCVIAPRELRSRRLLLRDNITPEQVEARLSSQQEDSFYTSRSDFVIENIAKPHHLETQVLEMLATFGLSPNGNQ